MTRARERPIFPEPPRLSLLAALARGSPRPGPGPAAKQRVLKVPWPGRGARFARHGFAFLPVARNIRSVVWGETASNICVCTTSWQEPQSTSPGAVQIPPPSPPKTLSSVSVFDKFRRQKAYSQHLNNASSPGTPVSLCAGLAGYHSFFSPTF